MNDEWEELGLREPVEVVGLPGVEKVLGRRLPEGGPEEVRFSHDGSIVLASMAGASRAYDVRSGQLVLDTPSYEVMERIEANPRRTKWEVIRFVAQVVTSAFGLLGGLDPKLTAHGRRLAKTLRRPTGLADFDLAARLVRKIDAEWPVLSPNGDVWASFEEDAPLVFYDARTGAELSRAKRKTTLTETGPHAFSRNGRLFAAERKRGTAGLWEVATGKLRRELKSHSADVGALALSPDAGSKETDGLLATAGGDGTIVLWDLETERWLARLAGWEQGIEWVDFVPHQDGLLLAVTDALSLGLFRVPSLEPVTRIARGEQGLGIFGAAVSPDGAYLAVGRQDDTIHLIEVGALVTAPERIEGDTVHLVSTGPPTEDDDRKAADAFQALVESRLEALSGRFEGELRTILARVPAGTVRIVFDCDPLLLTEGESVSWAVPGSGPRDLPGESPAGGALEAFREPLLPPETLADSRYLSAKVDPQEALTQLFADWMSRRWRAVAPADLDAVLVLPESVENGYDLRTGKWEHGE